MESADSRATTMFLLVERWHSSTYNLTDFCALHQLNVSDFYSWTQKYNAHLSSSSDSSASFTPLPFPQPQDADISDDLADTTQDSKVYLELITPSGFTLRFYRVPSLSYLQSLLS